MPKQTTKKESKTGKKEPKVVLTAAQSLLICTKFEEYNGHWSKLFRDEKIQDLGFSEKKIKAHVADVKAKVTEKKPGKGIGI